MDNISVGKILFDTSHAVKSALNSNFNDDITGFQARILGFILRENDQGRDVYRKDLEKEYHITPASVTSVVTNLEKNGYIERKTDKKDARQKIIVVTEKTNNFRKVHQKIIEEFERELSSNLSDEEISTFADILSKIVINAKKMEK